MGKKDIIQYYFLPFCLSGTASLDLRSNGKMSAIAFSYILVTTILGCLIAIAIFYIIKPGKLRHINPERSSFKSIIYVCAVHHTYHYLDYNSAISFGILY